MHTYTRTRTRSALPVLRPVRASGIAGYGPQVRFVYHRLTVTRDRNGQYHVLSHVAGVRSASTRTTSFASSASAVVMQDSVWSIVDGGTGSSAAVAAAPRALLDRYSLDKMPAPTGRVAHLGGRQHCEGRGAKIAHLNTCGT